MSVISYLHDCEESFSRGIKLKVKWQQGSKNIKLTCTVSHHFIITWLHCNNVLLYVLWWSRDCGLKEQSDRFEQKFKITFCTYQYCHGLLLTLHTGKLFFFFQMAAMRSLHNHEGHSMCDNFRPTQPLKGRTVSKYSGHLFG